MSVKPDHQKKKPNAIQQDPRRREISISKALSKLLRHQASDQNLNIDSQGFVKLNEILSHKYLKSFKTTPEDVFKIVSNDEKKRFRIIQRCLTSQNDDDITVMNYDPRDLLDYYICAQQGHSIKSVSLPFQLTLLKKTIDDYPTSIIHGTSLKNWELIKMTRGLSRMSRNHIHCTPGLPDWITEKRGDDGTEAIISDMGNVNIENDEESEMKIISGMRKSAQVLIYLDISKLISSDCDLKFYRSGNGVILTPGDADGFVNRDHFLKITDLLGNPIV